MLFTNYWTPVKNKRIQLHGMQIQVNIYFIWIRRTSRIWSYILQKYFILCSWIWCSSCWCIVAFAMVSHALLCNCNTRNDRQLLMVLSVLQNKWLATNGSKRTTNWASNIDILQYNLVLPMFFVGRKVAFQQSWPTIVMF